MTIPPIKPVTLRDHYDVVVVGGGINGTAVAHTAASRGLSTLLCQSQDLASGYSSDFPYFLTANLANLRRLSWAKLARAYRELAKFEYLAPHLMHPCTAIECYPNHWSWPVLENLFKIWRRNPSNAQCADTLLPKHYRRTHVAGFRVLDFRFTLANAMAAEDAGATIATRHELINGEREHGLWQLTVRRPEGFNAQITTPIVINATGPHVQEVLHVQLQSETRAGIQLLRLTHLVLRNKPNLQNAIFYHHGSGQRFGLTPINDQWLHFGPLITKTHLPITDAEISEDKARLLTRLNELTEIQFEEDDIAQCRSGLRAICDDGTSDDLNDLVLDINCPDGQSPLVNLLGGDLLAHRNTAARVLRLLKPYLPGHIREPGPVIPLPGGNITGVKELTIELDTTYHNLPASLLHRLRDTYGEASFEILGQAKTLADLGRDFGHHLTAAEADYLVNNEWARSAADILERRTGLSWQFSAAEVDALDSYLAEKFGDSQLTN